MMGGLALGGAYAVSAGLIIYGIESDLFPEEWHAPLLIIWSLAGLMLAVIGATRRKT